MAENRKNEPIQNTQVYKINAKKNKKKLNPITKKKIKTIIIAILIILLIVIGIGLGMIFGIVRSAKLGIEDLAIKYQNSVVKDIDGNIVANLSGDENRQLISMADMSQYLPKAFVAIEDERFYEHYGVDLKRTAAATVNYILHAGKSSFGGSTITQQMVKNLTSENERSWKRKVKEMSRAYYIEKELSKDQILELYLNLIFLGGNTYGVEVASTYYFSKSASELDLAESAFLAGINNSPNAYDPFSTEENDVNQIKRRTKIVLDKMKELGSINDEEFNTAIEKVDAGLPFAKGTIRQTIYSYHTDAAINQIVDELMKKNDWTYEYTRLYLFSSGFTIYTTQNTNIQTIMEEEFAKEKYQVASKKIEGAHSQAAMVLIDQKTGYVLATAGGLGGKQDAFGLNRGTQMFKQTGSSMKTLAVLAPGIESKAITAGTMFDDVPTTFGGFRPKNYGAYKGLMTVRYAIADSQNIPMVKGMVVLGPENSVKFLKSINFTKIDAEKDNGLSLALGGLTYGASPLEMAAGYAMIANDGVYIEPTFYTKVVDSNGNVILETEQESKTIMSKEAAYIVKEVLTQPVKSGTSTYCGISGMSVAAKTGTTNDDYDRWFCMFTPYYTSATWYGYDENETVRYSGYNPASLLTINVQRPIHKGLEGKTFAQTRPDGVVTATICRCSGKLATEACKNDPRGSQAYTEYFLKGTVPTENCTCHVETDICNDSGLLATEYCTNKTHGVYITREDADTNTSWQSATDAKYMLTIKDTCNIHTAPVVVADTTKPDIKLNGSSSITLTEGETYTEQGATATDDKDGDITSKITISGPVNINQPGTYTIAYNVKDSSNNSASITRTVVVKAKKKAENNVNTTPEPTVEPTPEPVDNNTISVNTNP